MVTCNLCDFVIELAVYKYLICYFSCLLFKQDVSVRELG